MAKTKEEGSDEIAKRFARIAGHAESLKRFWKEERECNDILTQISAVKAALDQVGKSVMQHHIDKCVAEAADSGKADKAAKDIRKALDRLV